MVAENKGSKITRFGGKNKEGQSGDPNVSLGLIIYFRVLLGHPITCSH